MDEKNTIKPAVAISVNLDTTPVLYTDNILISVNEDGVVLDVTQKLGSTNQARIVARIGMSRTQAKKLAQELGKLIAITEGQSKTGKKDYSN